jgi:hypothetical protein
MLWSEPGILSYDCVRGRIDDASLDYLHFRLETDGRLNDFLVEFLLEKKNRL